MTITGIQHEEIISKLQEECNKQLGIEVEHARHIKLQ